MLELTDKQAAEVARRGFVHIPGFLDASEIEMLRADFQNAVKKKPKSDYFRSVSGEVLNYFWPASQSLAKTLKRAAGIEVDGIYDGGVYFANYAARPNPNPKARGVRFPWHQDHESYYICQQAYHYINLYIAVDKPDPQRSNLTVLPFDRLQDRNPTASAALYRRGATRLVHRFGRWVVKDDDRGGTLCRLGFDPSEIEETPHLRAGDLLMLRGDVPHRTQDTETRRTAASFRMSTARKQFHAKSWQEAGW